MLTPEQQEQIETIRAKVSRILTHNYYRTHEGQLRCMYCNRPRGAGDSICRYKNAQDVIGRLCKDDAAFLLSIIDTLLEPACIPVSEQEPAGFVTTLVYCKALGWHTDWRRTDGWKCETNPGYLRDFKREDLTVTHWMPLPVAPVVAEKE